MCDIIVALPDSTSSGRTLFGKNSDRPAGECQVWYDSHGESRGSSIRCAFAEVADVPAPLRTRGCRPYWCWGYETGANEAGVVGGNTAVYTRALHLPENRSTLGLTGMELLRLGLERGRTAAETVGVITGLLAEYGQWAPAVQGKDAPDGCYENAFLIADPGEAWILETCGRQFAARRHIAGVHALSNQLTIRADWTDISPGLPEKAAAQGWWNGSGDFDFALACSDHEHYARQVSHVRWQRSRQMLRERAGRIDAAGIAHILRDHYEHTFLGGPMFNAYLPDLLSLCMHASPAGFTWGNTATSVVVDIDPAAPQSSLYWSCYQPPCTGVYVAGTLDAELPAAVSAPGTAGLRSESPVTVAPDAYHPDSLWWRMFRLLQWVTESPAERQPRVREKFDDIEQRGFTIAREAAGLPPEKRGPAMRACTEKQTDETMRAIEGFERAWGREGGTR